MRPKGYSVKIVKDSVNEVGNRLTTFELTYPRFVHSELLTHRDFCLAGDTVLEFDLPGGTSRGSRRVHRMRIDEFVDKWTGGARRIGARPKKAADLSVFEKSPGQMFSALEVASYLGMAHASTINGLCRDGILAAEKRNNRWMISGTEVVRWRSSALAENRFDMKSKLAGMRIRQLNEDSGDIQCSSVTDARFSGTKPVFTLHAGDFSVTASKDHRILTSDGWKRLGDIRVATDSVIVRKFGKKDDDIADPLRLKKVDGVWRNGWQADQRARMTSEDPLCRRCKQRSGTSVHHIVPVHADPSRTFDQKNITLLCHECHRAAHSSQGWQGGTYLYGASVPVDAIEAAGEQATFDIEIAGNYPNFVANGIVVHNSRNASSSRAIPTSRLIAKIRDEPALPVWWGKNQAGMQAQEQLSREEVREARQIWIDARDYCLEAADRLRELGLHKQLANRLIEPWMFITVLVTASNFGNWFHLRDTWLAGQPPGDAQPEIAWVAGRMNELYGEHKPRLLKAGQLHLPFLELENQSSELYVSPRELAELSSYPEAGVKKISSARCARVSYLTHDGIRILKNDIRLHDQLIKNGHWSPLEHVATALPTSERIGNFVGWRQYRKEFDNEYRG